MKLIIGSEGKGIWAYKIMNYFLHKIDPTIEIEYNNVTHCDFIIRSTCSYEENWNKESKKYIYWSCESFFPFQSEYQTKTLFMMSFLYNDIYNYIYVPFFLFSPYLHKNRIAPNHNREYLVAYCSSNKVTERETIFDLFVEKTNDQVCHAYGHCYGKYINTKKDKAPGVWDSEDLMNIYKKYKFVIAMENKCQDGYVTEKIINAFYSGAIPIYWGSSNVCEFFNKDAFINVNDFTSFEECVDYIVSMSEEQIQEMTNQPIYNTDNEILNLLNDEYNSKQENKTLEFYLQKVREFLE